MFESRDYFPDDIDVNIVTYITCIVNQTTQYVFLTNEDTQHDRRRLCNITDKCKYKCKYLLYRIISHQKPWSIIIGHKYPTFPFV